MDKYGDDRMGAFAEAVAGQWIPYRLDAAGRDAFGTSISEEWRLWTRELTAQAEALRAQGRARGAPVPQRLTTHGRYALYPRVSPDGTEVAYAAADGRSDVQISVLSTTGGEVRRHVRTNGVANFDWTADGQLVFTQFQYQGPYRTYVDLYRTEARGGVRRLTRGARLTDVSVAPRGSWAVAVQEGGGTEGLVRVDLASGAVTTLVASEADVHWSFPAVSPDGRWIAYVSNETAGNNEVYVRSFPDAMGGRWQVSIDGGTSPVWSADDRTLYYLDGTARLVAATVRTAPAFGVIDRQPLFDASRFRIDGFHQAFAVAPDGRAFYFIRSVGNAGRSAADVRAVLVEHWFDDLKAKLAR